MLEVVKDCDFCRRTKVQHPITNQTIPRSEVLGEMWFVDVKGKIATPSLKFKNHYVFGIIESKSRYLIQYFIRNKSDVLECIKKFVKVYILPLRVLNPRLQKVYIHSDMGEFDSQKIRDFLYEHAIFTTTACAYMSEHNGVIERVWRTITEAAICNLLVSELTEEYWEEARGCAAYVYNRIPGAHYGKFPLSPYEMYWGITPRIRHFKIFGSMVYAMIPHKRKDHSSRAQRGVFVGYQDRQPVGYRVYLPATNEFIITFQATFVESPNAQPEVAKYYLDGELELLRTQHERGPTGQPIVMDLSGSAGSGSDVDVFPPTMSRIEILDEVVESVAGVGTDHPGVRQCESGEDTSTLVSADTLLSCNPKTGDVSVVSSEVHERSPIGVMEGSDRTISDSNYEDLVSRSVRVDGRETSNDETILTLSSESNASMNGRPVTLRGANGPTGGGLSRVDTPLLAPDVTVMDVVEDFTCGDAGVLDGIFSRVCTAEPIGSSGTVNRVELRESSVPALNDKEALGLTLGNSKSLVLDETLQLDSVDDSSVLDDSDRRDKAILWIDERLSEQVDSDLPGTPQAALDDQPCPWRAEERLKGVVDCVPERAVREKAGPCAPQELRKKSKKRQTSQVYDDGVLCNDRVDEPGMSSLSGDSVKRMMVAPACVAVERVEPTVASNASGYDGLIGSRHIDDEDGRMYQVVQLYFSKAHRKHAVRRVRVSRYGVLEDAGSFGNILADYAVQLTRMSDAQGWSSNYRRLTMSTSENSGFLGVVSNDCIRRGEVHAMDEALVLDESSRKRVLTALSIAAGYGDILSLYALSSGVVNVDIRVPTTHKQVLRSPHKVHWLAAEQAEMESFRENEVLEPSWLPPNRKALRTKWIYTVKYDTEGRVKKYKARLVARGYEQIFGVDFDETFSPVTRLTSLRLLFALSAQLGLVAHQMDVKTAFLNAALEEETYIEVPEGVDPGVECNCFRLKRALYGLKQSPRMWNININAYLLSLGFAALPNEPCLYFRKQDSKMAIIALYVDDMVIAGSDLETVQDIKNKLSERYQMSDLGEVNQILGCEVTRDWTLGRLTMIQRQYIRLVIKKFFPGIVLNPVRTPMGSKVYLNRSQCPLTPEDIAFMKSIPYRQAVGCLLWLAMGTRPDIAYAVSQVARFCENPGRAHWEAVQRIFRYLLGTIDLGLCYRRTEDSLNGVMGCVSEVEGSDVLSGCEVGDQLRIYSDSDHARCVDTRRSVTGFVFYLAGAPICWQSRQQPTVALSSMEAEYMAACSATQEALWLIALLKGLGFSQSKPVPIFEDNQSAIAYSKNPTNHKYTKHIATKYHFVREQVELLLIELVKVMSAANTADVFTKPLDQDAHWRHTDAMLTTITGLIVALNVL